MKKNSVFIATSLDGYISDKNGSIDWLETVPEINTVDTGYHSFMDTIDALVMGRITFETVLSFGIDWPYEKPVYVLSSSLQTVPEDLKGKVFILGGELKKILQEIHSNGHHALYIDGGTTIQAFIAKNLIDEMIITTIPILLGGGSPLFGALLKPVVFKLKESKVYLGRIVQEHYVKK